jgi:hypothetical protein
LYKEPANSPFVPTIQKDIMKQRYFETNPKPQPQEQGEQQDPKRPNNPPLYQQRPGFTQKPIVDLQVYEPVKPPAKPKPLDVAAFMPFITTNPMYPPQWANCYQQIPGVTLPPIIKNYSINVSGPTTDHAKLAAIYEDILPGRQFTNTSNTLGERMNIYSFIRSVFIKQNDGEDVSIDGTGKDSLLSYLKFMEINPYHSNHFTDNPYSSLPEDMLIYNSCYPIRYDRYSGSVQCAPNAMGINIRIYRLTMGEYSVKKNQGAKYSEFNIWREIAYYEFIREQVLKRKVCPNFVLMYGYYICEKCNIDFDKLALLKGKNKPKESTLVATIKLPDGTQKQTPWNPYTMLKQPEDTNSLIPAHKNPQQEAQVTIETNSAAFSGRAVIALTEAPTYNIYAWTSKTYKVEGNIRRMMNTGFHRPDVWLAILFQLMTAMFVLQINNVAFRDFTLKDNVYIKDIQIHENVTNYWKYVVDGVDYYIPNNGYLLLIDSNYKDIDTGDCTLIKLNKPENYKIHSNIYGSDKDSTYNLAFSSFVNAIDPNSFSKSFNHLGGTNLPDEVKDLLTKMYTYAKSSGSEKDIGHYIFTYMRRFLNNRVGTLLKELEIKNIRRDDNKQFRRGEMVVYMFQADTYKFAIYLGPLQTPDSRVRILTTSNNSTNKEIVDMDVTIDQLFHYSTYEPIVQNYKPTEADLNEENLLEIYNIGRE